MNVAIIRANRPSETIWSVFQNPVTNVNWTHILDCVKLFMMHFSTYSVIVTPNELGSPR